jgi:hypothetical protein
MKIKKIMTKSCIGLCLLTLIGCQSESYKKAKIYLTPVEKEILAKYYNGHSFAGYDLVLSNIERKRSFSSPYTNLVPFCDILDVLKVEEEPTRESMKTGYAISKQWHQLHGETLIDSCNNNSDFEYNKLDNIKSSESEDLIIVDKSKLLSPKKVIELSKLVNTCHPSKNKLSNLIEGGRYLSEKDYEKVIKIELDCAYYQLNTEINKK